RHRVGRRDGGDPARRVAPRSGGDRRRRRARHRDGPDRHSALQALMQRSNPERIYGLRELTRILSLTPKRAAQLRRLDLLRQDSGYTFRDLLALRAASALLDAGASVRQIRGALTALRKQDPGIQDPLTEVRLVVEGGRLLAQSDRVRFDPRSGQIVLALDTVDLTQAALATLATGLVRPLQPPAEQAEMWFDRASEWDADPGQW